jgi:hypothetical protein
MEPGHQAPHSLEICIKTDENLRRKIAILDSDIVVFLRMHALCKISDLFDTDRGRGMVCFE